MLGLPKAELHIHLEGTLEPQTILEFAQRNNLTSFPFSTSTQIKQRMGASHDLPSFIQIYEQLLSVLLTADDFHNAAMKYFKQVHSQGVVYVEMFFDPQMHTSRNISFNVVMDGLRRAKKDALEEFGINCNFIMCFNRDKSIDSAMEHLQLALEHKDIIIGVGTDNPEHTGFPKDFQEVFQKAKQAGFRLTSHCDADHESSVSNIKDCLHLLQVERIDHGVNVLDDEELVELARQSNIGFTVCPAKMYDSDLEIRMGYFMRCAEAAKGMLDAGLRVTLSSDDPGIMCSCYIGDIYVEVRALICLSTGIPLILDFNTRLIM